MISIRTQMQQSRIFLWTKCHISFYNLDYCLLYLTVIPRSQVPVYELIAIDNNFMYGKNYVQQLFYTNDSWFMKRLI